MLTDLVEKKLVGLNFKMRIIKIPMVDSSINFTEPKIPMGHTLGFHCQKGGSTLIKHRF